MILFICFGKVSFVSFLFRMFVDKNQNVRKYVGKDLS
jgi:hypothetical protein